MRWITWSVSDLVEQVRFQLRFSQHQNFCSYYVCLPWVSGFHVACSIKENSNLQFFLSLEFQKVFCSFGTKMTATFCTLTSFCPSSQPPFIYKERAQTLFLHSDFFSLLWLLPWMLQAHYLSKSKHRTSLPLPLCSKLLITDRPVLLISKLEDSCTCTMS